jgi:hypothetical protein
VSPGKGGKNPFWSTSSKVERAGEKRAVCKNTIVTSINIVAGTNIKFNDQITVGNVTDVTRSNIRHFLTI